MFMPVTMYTFAACFAAAMRIPAEAGAWRFAPPTQKV
jgi:hypothetical protein